MERMRGIIMSKRRKREREIYKRKQLPTAPRGGSWLIFLRSFGSGGERILLFPLRHYYTRGERHTRQRSTNVCFRLTDARQRPIQSRFVIRIVYTQVYSWRSTCRPTHINLKQRRRRTYFFRSFLSASLFFFFRRW
jgi:hypothetical protein